MTCTIDIDNRGGARRSLDLDHHYIVGVVDVHLMPDTCGEARVDQDNSPDLLRLRVCKGEDCVGGGLCWERQFSGLIHLVALMEFGSSPLASSTSLISSGLPALKEKGTKYTTTLYCLGRIVADSPSFPRKVALSS